MAESIVLGAFLQVLFEKTASVILIPRLKALWGGDVKKEMEKLQRSLSLIQAVLKGAEERQLKDEAIRLWLAQLKDAAYEADDIFDDFHWEVMRQEAEDNTTKSKVSNFFSSENPILFRIRMGRRIKEIAARLNHIAEERSKFYLDTSNHHPASDNQFTSRETHSYVIESEVVGREEDKNKIVEMLISCGSNDSVSVLPIFGMGGLGKTTLAQQVYNDPRTKVHFQQLMMWVCVSDEFVVSRLAEKIIEAAGGKCKRGSSMESLQQILRQTLGLKKYLLVLDDVWNEDATKWEELRVLLSHGGRGSVILTTTRIWSVSSLMGTIDAHSLDRLSEEHCWMIFKRRAFASATEETPDLARIGKEIVKKFGGLPLAAKTVGGFMRLKKDEEEWLSVLKDEIWDLPVGETTILPALQLSYNNLPSYLKECFAYCAIFPKDYDLRNDVLVQLWMANGLIPPGRKMELEDKGQEIFNELVSRSFLQNVCESRRYGLSFTICMMHDLIHDLARAITKNKCYVVGDKSMKGNPSITTSHISLTPESTMAMVDKAISDSSGGVRTLLSLDFFQGVQNCNYPYLKAKSLRVLDLPRTKNLITKPLMQIDRLKHLRYLDIAHMSIVTLPEAITRLFHLQTLKLDRCYGLRRLPMGMKNLKSLRHLDLDGCYNLTCMPRGMGSLTCLRTLSMYVVGTKAGSGCLNELKQLNIMGRVQLRGLQNVTNPADAKEANLRAKSKIQDLDLRWDSEGKNRPENIDQEVMECLEPHSNVKKLEIFGYQGINFPNWMTRCAAHLRNLVQISLHYCIKCEDLPMLGELPLLEGLTILGMAGLKYLGGSQSSLYGPGGGGSAVEIFPSLERFRMKEMKNLEWWGLEATGALTFFPRLIHLYIEDCPKLMTIPHLPSIQSLVVTGSPSLLPERGFFLGMESLKRLEIGSCSKLAVRLIQEEVTESGASFGELEDLKVFGCDGLISLSDEVMRLLCSLKRLSIECCRNLVGSSSSSSPSSSSPISITGGVQGLQLGYLASLESLRIWNCETLVVDMQNLPPSLKSISFTNLGRLVSLPQSMSCLNGLTNLRIKGLSCLQGLNNLVGLQIGGEVRLEALPDTLGGGVTSLEDLEINDCCNLISLPQGLWGLTQLKSLSITGCPELASLPEGLEGFSELRALKIMDCPKLTSGLQQLLPRLEYLGIFECPNLQKHFAAGGKYRHLTSHIPRAYIEPVGGITNWRLLTCCTSSFGGSAI